MTISVSGAVEWTVPATVAGLVPVTFAVSDGKGGLAEQTYEISVSGSGNRAPRIYSQPLTSATVGARYTYQVSASDPDGDALTYALTSAPSGMTIDAATGRIDWTPAASHNGNQAVQVTVRDARGASAVQNYSIYVQLGNNQPPRITSQPPQRATPGLTYSYTVVATDPDRQTLSYSLVKAPAGMTISATGQVLWTAPAVGDHNIEIRVSDPLGAYATQTYVLRVGVNGAPVITSIPVSAAQMGNPYSYQIVANDPDGDFLVYTLTGGGATFSVSSSGLVTATPDRTGSFNLTVTVSDGQASTQQSWTVRVSEPLALLASASIQFTSRFINVGESTTIQVVPQGGTPPYTVTGFSINGRPVTLDAAFKTVFTATATATGRQAVRATVRDSKNATFTLEDWFGVADPSDSDEPLALITAPVRSDNINVATIPTLTDILGTASDSNLGGWELLMSPAGENAWSTLARGSSSEPPRV